MFNCLRGKHEPKVIGKLKHMVMGAEVAVCCAKCGKVSTMYIGLVKMRTESKLPKGYKEAKARSLYEHCLEMDMLERNLIIMDDLESDEPIDKEKLLAWYNKHINKEAKDGS